MKHWPTFSTERPRHSTCTQGALAIRSAEHLSIGPCAAPSEVVLSISLGTVASHESGLRITDFTTSVSKCRSATALRRARYGSSRRARCSSMAETSSEGTNVLRDERGMAESVGCLLERRDGGEGLRWTSPSRRWSALAREATTVTAAGRPSQLLAGVSALRSRCWIGCWPRFGVGSAPGTSPCGRWRWTVGGSGRRSVHGREWWRRGLAVRSAGGRGRRGTPMLSVRRSGP
jgi:hypothetical protein